MSLSSICLVGANGTLGSVLLPALLAADFKVTVLQRANSASTPPSADHPNVSVAHVDPDFALPDLTEALRGHDAVVAAFPLPGRLDHHLRLAYAAASAGVRRFVPADFGSCDSARPEALRRLQLYRDKVRVRERCEELAREFGATGFTWTALVCGHFFDFGLRDGLLHFDLGKREALILDGGNAPASASTLARVGEALVAVLQRPDQTANRTLFVHSFNPTQRQVLASLERAMGGEPWTVHEDDSAAYLDRQQAKLDAGDRHVVEDIVFALGAVDADWTTRPTFAMDLLGLENEDLDEVVGRVVKEHQAAAKGA